MKCQTRTPTVRGAPDIAARKKAKKREPFFD